LDGGKPEINTSPHPDANYDQRDHAVLGDDVYYHGAAKISSQEYGAQDRRPRNKVDNKTGQFQKGDWQNGHFRYTCSRKPIDHLRSTTNLHSSSDYQGNRHHPGKDSTCPQVLVIAHGLVPFFVCRDLGGWRARKRFHQVRDKFRELARPRPIPASILLLKRTEKQADL